MTVDENASALGALQSGSAGTSAGTPGIGLLALIVAGVAAALLRERSG